MEELPTELLYIVATFLSSVDLRSLLSASSSLYSRLYPEYRHRWRQRLRHYDIATLRSQLSEQELCSLIRPSIPLLLPCRRNEEGQLCYVKPLRVNTIELFAVYELTMGGNPSPVLISLTEEERTTIATFLYELRWRYQRLPIRLSTLHPVVVPREVAKFMGLQRFANVVMDMKYLEDLAKRVDEKRRTRDTQSEASEQDQRPGDAKKSKAIYYYSLPALRAWWLLWGMQRGVVTVTGNMVQLNRERWEPFAVTFSSVLQRRWRGELSCRRWLNSFANGETVYLTKREAALAMLEELEELRSCLVVNGKNLALLDGLIFD